MTILLTMTSPEHNCILAWGMTRTTRSQTSVTLYTQNEKISSNAAEIFFAIEQDLTSFHPCVSYMRWISVLPDDTIYVKMKLIFFSKSIKTSHNKKKCIYNKWDEITTLKKYVTPHWNKILFAHLNNFTFTLCWKIITFKFTILNKYVKSVACCCLTPSQRLRFGLALHLRQNNGNAGE